MRRFCDRVDYYLPKALKSIQISLAMLIYGRPTCQYHGSIQGVQDQARSGFQGGNMPHQKTLLSSVDISCQSTSVSEIRFAQEVTPPHRQRWTLLCELSGRFGARLRIGMRSYPQALGTADDIVGVMQNADDNIG